MYLEFSGRASNKSTLLNRNIQQADDTTRRHRQLNYSYFWIILHRLHFWRTFTSFRSWLNWRHTFSISSALSPWRASFRTGPIIAYLISSSSVHSAGIGSGIFQRQLHHRRFLWDRQPAFGAHLRQPVFSMKTTAILPHGWYEIMTLQLTLSFRFWSSWARPWTAMFRLFQGEPPDCNYTQSVKQTPLRRPAGNKH